MKYSSEHHNWDMTIMASSHLVVMGRNFEGKSSYSAFTGAMVLAVAGLESFLNSVAYSVATNDSEFNFDKFESKPITKKVDCFLERFKIELNKDARPYVTVNEAVAWRHSLAHSKPTYVEESEINSIDDVVKLPVKHASEKYQYEPYEESVNEANADKFNRDIISIIEKIKKASGIDPHASSTYTL